LKNCRLKDFVKFALVNFYKKFNHLLLLLLLLLLLYMKTMERLNNIKTMPTNVLVQDNIFHINFMQNEDAKVW